MHVSCRKRGRVVKAPGLWSTRSRFKTYPAILLRPWDSHFMELSPAWWSWQAVQNFSRRRRRRRLKRFEGQSFEGHLKVRHKQDWGREFILLLSQTAALPESDAGSGVIKPASNFVIQNRQTSCSMWCPMYRTRC